MTTDHAHIEEHHHPGARQYIIIGTILAILTGIEFGVFYLSLNPALMTWVILTLSGSKFMLVVGYFMHLKFDDARFSLLFFAPFFIMISLAAVLMALFFNLTR